MTFSHLVTGFIEFVAINIEVIGSTSHERFADTAVPIDSITAADRGNFDGLTQLADLQLVANDGFCERAFGHGTTGLAKHLLEPLCWYGLVMSLRHSPQSMAKLKSQNS